jgi:adenylate cyclase
VTAHGGTIDKIAGDAINTAARIEGANKHLGTSILVAAATAAACPELAFRPAGRLLLAGRARRSR